MNKSTANIVSVRELICYLHRCYGVPDADAKFTKAALKLEREIQSLIRARDQEGLEHLVAQIKGAAA